MKMIKAMKKLKFWSRKKKKKKSLFFTEQEQQQRQPPTVCSSHYHHHCHYYPVEPSAPPLPSWLDNDDDQIQDPILASDKLNPTISATSSEAPPCTAVHGRKSCLWCSCCASSSYKGKRCRSRRLRVLLWSSSLQMLLSLFSHQGSQLNLFIKCCV